MKRILAAVMLVGIAITLCVTMPTTPKKNYVQWGQIQTDYIRIFDSIEVFRGCPNVTWRLEPTGHVVVTDPLWTDTMDALRLDLDKNSYQHVHVAQNRQLAHWPPAGPGRRIMY